MTSGLDIYRAANLLIKQHWKDAPVRATMRPEESGEARDVEGEGGVEQIWECDKSGGVGWD